MTKKRQVKSNSKSAKQIIRSEIRSVYSPKNCGGGRSTVFNMKKDADAYNCGDSLSKFHSNYEKGLGLAQAGGFAIYYDDQRNMLNKIYGKKNVDTWNNNKVHNTYKHLIGREYSAMLQETKRKK